jgi:hypothetical protein
MRKRDAFIVSECYHTIQGSAVLSKDDAALLITRVRTAVGSLTTTYIYFSC